MKRLIKRQERVYSPKTGEPISSTQYALSFLGDEDVYMSFTEIEKLGVNPRSKYDTPLGIYTYLVDRVLSDSVTPNLDLPRYRRIGDFVPFAGDSPYVTFVRNNKKFRSLSSRTYTKSDAREDLEALNSYFVDSSKQSRDMAIGFEVLKKKFGIDGLDIEDEDDDYFLALTGLRDNGRDHYINAHRVFDDILLHSAHEYLEEEGFGLNPAALIYTCSLYVATTLCKGRESSIPLIWSKVLRDLGFGMVEDYYGDGFIHENEGTQAVFLTTRAFDVIGRINNTAYDPFTTRGS